MNRRLKNLAMITSLGAAMIPAAFWPCLRASSSPVQQASVGQQGQKDFEQRALAADHAFVEAALRSDMSTLDKMLDVRFTWTDANGRTLTRQEVLQQAPKPAGVLPRGTIEIWPWLVGIALALLGVEWVVYLRGR